MGVEDGKEKGRAKLGHIGWKSNVDPSEIDQRNTEAARNLGIDPNRGERNRNTLLAGIDRSLIEITRRKSEIILGAIPAGDRVRAETMIDSILKTHHPKDLISILHAVDTSAPTTNAANHAAMALAFLALTEGY